MSEVPLYARDGVRRWLRPACIHGHLANKKKRHPGTLRKDYRVTPLIRNGFDKKQAFLERKFC